MKKFRFWCCLDDTRQEFQAFITFNFLIVFLSFVGLTMAVFFEDFDGRENWELITEALFSFLWLHCIFRAALITENCKKLPHAALKAYIEKGPLFSIKHEKQELARYVEMQQMKALLKQKTGFTLFWGMLLVDFSLCMRVLALLGTLLVAVVQRY